jgi:hypothetical protein
MKKIGFYGFFCVVLLTSLLLVGCGSPRNSTVINIMKRMPDDTTEFSFQDFNKGRAMGAGDLNEAYNRYMDVTEEGLLEWHLDADEADYLAWCMMDAPVFFIGGDFTLDSIREKLEKSGMYREEYRGVEIWTGGDSTEAGYQGDFVHALINNKLVVIGYEGGVEICIEVINEGAPSVYENADFRDIVERLPEGLTMSCSLHWNMEVEDIIIGGFSLEMNDDGTQDFTFVGKFQNSKAAGNGIDIILNDLADDFRFELASATTTQDGEYITIKAEGQEIY